MRLILYCQLYQVGNKCSIRTNRIGDNLTVSQVQYVSMSLPIFRCERSNICNNTFAWRANTTRYCHLSLHYRSQSSQIKRMIIKKRKNSHSTYLRYDSEPIPPIHSLKFLQTFENFSKLEKQCLALANLAIEYPNRFKAWSKFEH